MSIPAEMNTQGRVLGTHPKGEGKEERNLE